jgi:nuclear pore complex protein Nup107
MLASKIPSLSICRSKTPSILGRSLNFDDLEYSGEEPDLTEVLGWSSERSQLLRKHLLAEARSFRELETLIESLDYMETIASMGELLVE